MKSRSDQEFRSDRGPPKCHRQAVYDRRLQVPEPSLQLRSQAERRLPTPRTALPRIKGVRFFPTLGTPSVIVTCARDAHPSQGLHWDELAQLGFATNGSRMSERERVAKRLIAGSSIIRSIEHLKEPAPRGLIALTVQGTVTSLHSLRNPTKKGPQY